MRVIAAVLALLSLLAYIGVMVSGLKAGHGQDFLMSHLYWGFGTLGLIVVSFTLSLMFIFKMHGIIHTLLSKLEKYEGEN